MSIVIEHEAGIMALSLMAADARRAGDTSTMPIISLPRNNGPLHDSQLSNRHEKSADWRRLAHEARREI